MSEALEITQSDRITEEELKRKSYNSRISENYRRMMTMDSSELKNGGVEERKYPALDAYKPLHARREITFEDVQIPEEVQKEMQTLQRSAQTDRAHSSPAIDFQNSIYASPAYREAALRRERAATAAEAADETLSSPTKTTLQYGNVRAQIASQTVSAANTAAEKRTAVSASEDSRAYYAALAKKIAVVLAVTFVVMMAVITVNSAILNGMNIQIIELQQTLNGLQAEIQELQQSIAAETGWESIWSFIQANGMIPRG